MKVHYKNPNKNNTVSVYEYAACEKDADYDPCYKCAGSCRMDVDMRKETLFQCAK